MAPLTKYLTSCGTQLMSFYSHFFSPCNSTVVTCGTVPSIENGVVTDVTSKVAGGVASYECNTGYHLATVERQITCMNNTQWSNEEIVCEEGIISIHNVSKGPK